MFFPPQFNNIYSAQINSSLTQCFEKNLSTNFQDYGEQFSKAKFTYFHSMRVRLPAITIL